MIAPRTLLLAGFLAFAFALPSAANAAPGFATGDVNLRTGPGTRYQRILVVPRGAGLEVYRCTSWCQVNYRGYRGWVYGRYVSLGPYYRAPVPFFDLPPRSGYRLQPWWDRRYGAWYDGRRWYYRGRWYDRPTFYFRFEFGG